MYKLQNSYLTPEHLAVVACMYSFPDLHGHIPPHTGCCIYSAVNSGHNTKNAGNNNIIHSPLFLL